MATPPRRDERAQRARVVHEALGVECTHGVQRRAEDRRVAVAAQECGALDAATEARRRRPYEVDDVPSRGLGAVEERRRQRRRYSQTRAQGEAHGAVGRDHVEEPRRAVRVGAGLRRHGACAACSETPGSGPPRRVWVELQQQGQARPHAPRRRWRPNGGAVAVL